MNIVKDNSITHLVTQLGDDDFARINKFKKYDTALAFFKNIVKANSDNADFLVTLLERAEPNAFSTWKKLQDSTYNEL